MQICHKPFSFHIYFRKKNFKLFFRPLYSDQAFLDFLNAIDLFLLLTCVFMSREKEYCRIFSQFKFFICAEVSIQIFLKAPYRFYVHLKVRIF